MKTYLIKASAPGPFKEYKKYMGAPPQNIFALAACTPKDIKVDMCDQTIDMRPDMRTDADIVVLLFHTPDAIHAYKMADAYRAKGKTVVLGGLHASFMPTEATQHANALLIGEIEGIWEELLADFQAGTLKKRYQRTTPVDMATLNPYPTHIIKPSRYNDLWSVLVSRGCVHRCEYCVVPPFFRGKYRLRPVDQIVAEIKAAPTNWIELHADNLTANREYAVKLFNALKPLKINWIGESTIKMADDEELLKLAGESGCKSLLIGIETPSQASLDKAKGIITPQDVRDRIRKFHAHGIQITSSMIFGFDTHTKDIFRESLEFSREIEIDEVESVLLTPFPGTPLYKRMDKEGRLLTKDWSRYDCANVTFKPKHMTAKELDEGAYWFWKEIQKKTPGKKKKTSDSSYSGPSNPSSYGSRIKWKSMLALALIGTAIALDQYWLWGVLFLAWAINDLRNRRTYLVEDIPRSESPIMYWVVVTLWLSLAIWALGYAPKVQEFLSAIPLADSPVETLANASPNEAPKAPVTRINQEGFKKIPAATPQPVTKTTHPTVIAYKGAGLSIATPKSWTSEKKDIADGRQLEMKAPSGRATLTCLVLDMGKQFKKAEFIALMENELSAALPFIKTGSGKGVDIVTPQDTWERLTFMEYSGNLSGEPVRAIVAYGAKQKHGFMLIGVYGKGDSVMKEALQKTLASLILTHG